MWGLFYLLFHLPLSLYLSLSLSLTTRHSVFGTAALIFLRGRQRILKATITAQNYQFPLLLTLWEERGRGRGRRERRRRREIQIWDEEGPPRSGPPPPDILLPGCSHVFGLRGERITPPQDELDPATGGQTSYYRARAPLSSLPANRPGHCSTNADCMLITSARATAQSRRKLRER